MGLNALQKFHSVYYLEGSEFKDKNKQARLAVLIKALPETVSLKLW